MSCMVSCERVVDVCVRVQDAALERDVDFWISLCCQFEVIDQLTSLISILNFLLQLPDDKDDGETKFRLDKNRIGSMSLPNNQSQVLLPHCRNI